MTRRFWISVALTIPVLILGMSDLIPGQPLQQFLSMRAIGWIELLLATPIVLWGGFPFFQRGWASIVKRSLNMFTLIAHGTGTAYVYSVIAVIFPNIFPPSFQTMSDIVRLTTTSCVSQPHSVIPDCLPFFLTYPAQQNTFCFFESVLEGSSSVN